jgi:hypothetical protein
MWQGVYNRVYQLMEPRVEHSEREWAIAEMELLVEEAQRRLDEVSPPGKPWAAALRDGVDGLLDLLAQRPPLAHMALIDAPAAGARAFALYESARAALTSYVERGAEQAVEEGIPASAGRAAVAGAEALLAGQVLAGKAERLGELAPDVVYLLAVPYLGQDEAMRLSAKSAARPRLRAAA